MAADRFGNMTIEISYNDLAPKHAANFDSLVAAKFMTVQRFTALFPAL